MSRRTAAHIQIAVLKAEWAFDIQLIHQKEALLSQKTRKVQEQKRVFSHPGDTFMVSEISSFNRIVKSLLHSLEERPLNRLVKATGQYQQLYSCRMKLSTTEFSCAATW